MAELKTKLNDGSVDDYLNLISDPKKKEDCYHILNMMKELTGEEPKMWGDSIIGFGVYHYVYASGSKGDWPIVGFSPRKQNITLYIMSGFTQNEELLSKLGKFKTGKSCLYIKKIEDINQDLLKKLITESIDFIKNYYNK